MAYCWTLGNGQQIYLDNQGEQTVITSLIASAGQQQQSGNSFTTGKWTQAPEMFVTPSGVLLRLHTERGETSIAVQGGSMSMSTGAQSIGTAQQVQAQQVSSMPQASIPPMQPMAPMQPMQPLNLGGMQMSMNPMEMRMGNMAMSMGMRTSTSTPTGSERKFCTQCGAPTQPTDRFCSSCGHQLTVCFV
jgi:hypothetical protein